MSDAIEAPTHYVEGRLYEPRLLIEDWQLGWNLGNVVKYVARAGRKGPALADLLKAQRYLAWEIEKHMPEGRGMTDLDTNGLAAGGVLGE